MTEDVNKVITALGAICEIGGFMMTQLQKNGFTREEAYEIVANYILDTITSDKKTKESKEESSDYE